MDIYAGTTPYTNFTATGVAEIAPRVSRLTTSIQKAIATNMEIAEQLEQKLHAVLMPSVPQAETASNPNGPTREVMSPISSDLETFERQLYALSARYTDILNRLEV